jgi:hypothetical protein
MASEWCEISMWVRFPDRVDFPSDALEFVKALRAEPIEVDGLVRRSVLGVGRFGFREPVLFGTVPE